MMWQWPTKAVFHAVVYSLLFALPILCNRFDMHLVLYDQHINSEIEQCNEDEKKPIGMGEERADDVMFKNENHTVYQIKQCKGRGAMPIGIGERRADDAMFKNENRYKALVIGVMEYFYSLFVTLVLFTLLSFNKYVYTFLVALFFAIGAASDYYLFNFARTLSVSVVQEIFENETALIIEYIQPMLIAAVIISSGLFLLIRNYRLSTKLSAIIISVLLTCVSISAIYDYSSRSLFVLRSTVQAYMPMNAFYSVSYYIMKSSAAKDEYRNRFDISKAYQYKFKPSGKEPLVVVMVLGESLRGDLLTLNGGDIRMPRLEATPGLVSFRHARSYANITRESIPLMLTRANGSDFEQAQKESSVISVFKSLGFATAWIGNQGLFSGDDPTFGSIAMEADYVVSRSDLRIMSGVRNTFDDFMLPIISDYLKRNTGKNIFLVVHMLGSHWKFDERYPPEFKKFTPTCNKSPYTCSKEEILNGYRNSIFYSDYVLDQILSLLKGKNAFMLYASDHGFSLMENGNFSNATPHKPKEELDIAMFFWGSDKYLASHQYKFTSLSAMRDEKVSHDNIFHTLLGASNIASNAVNPHFDLCSEKVKIDSPR